MHRLKWPIMCFVAVAFWNMIGAGVLGYLVNTPLALYYVQGLNMTPTHAHAALFGVYGFLSLGFVFFVMRYIRPDVPFNDRLMKVGFWCLNFGLALMLVLSLIPVGILQSIASIQYGLWFARSESFMQEPLLQVLRWMRMLGDTIFIIGAACFFAQVVMMIKGKSKD